MRRPRGTGSCAGSTASCPADARMHPALSIVFFTTASGAGFALLMLLGLGAPLGLLPTSASFGFAALAIAALLAAGGLASSIFHLGRPERAWRALSQWPASLVFPHGGAFLSGPLSSRN